ncbi:T9SS type B sorting domain-containing protein [Saccharicrinis carchari]|nr:gliding motility-associated C-terminal domain-containing protein [Saccharicrinis carchari]
MQKYSKYSNPHAMHRYFLFFFLISANLSAQFTENWDDSSFSTPLVWQGDLDKYTINTVEHQLLLTAPSATSEAYISTPSTALIDAAWEFTVHMDFNPSGSNYAQLFLACNQATYNDKMEGYYVMVGDTEDEVSLWKREAGNNLKIIDGRDKILDSPSVTVTIKVQRNSVGNWQLHTRREGEDFTLEGEVLDNSISTSNYFGIYCRYTSTRSDKFSFGPVSVLGAAFVDTVKPLVTSHQLLAANQISLLFNEHLDSSSISNGKFAIEPDGIHPDKVVSNNRRVNVFFNAYLQDTDAGLLSVKDIRDKSGNIMNDTSLTYRFKRIKLLHSKVLDPNNLQLYFNKNIDASLTNIAIAESELNFSTPLFVKDSTLLIRSNKPMLPHQIYTVKLTGILASFGDIIKDTTLNITYRPAHRFDIIFTELMPDETPNVGLFHSEYIEIYNRRDYPINLDGMKLIINDKESVLPNYLLSPGAYAIIINQKHLDNWPADLPVIPIKSLPVLTNSAGTLILHHANNLVSDVIQYPIVMDDGGFKASGGWSIERKDLNNHQPDYNWGYAMHLDGGTPGTENSIHAQNPDTIPPRISYLSYIDAHTFKIVFNEALKNTDTFAPSIIQVEQATVSEIIVDPIFINSIEFSLEEDIPAGQIFEAGFSKAISDFAGNTLNNSVKDQKLWLRLGVPETIDSFDICINEVLFNPQPDDVDFVELYNRSDKTLNRSDIYLATLSHSTSDILIPDKLKRINNKNSLFFPNDYLVVSSDIKKTEAKHVQTNSTMLNQASLPAMGNDEGSIAIAQNNGLIIDYFIYSSDMHFELLRNKEGVSLERVSPNAPSNNYHNWHSASQHSAYATPTQQNSQYSDYAPKDNGDWVSLEKEAFSPNADGTDDFLRINYSLGEPGWTGTISIYNRYGRVIKTVVSNQLLGVQGFFIWDGTNHNHQKADMGIYIVYADFFSTSGKRKQRKIATVLTAGRKK